QRGKTCSEVTALDWTSGRRGPQRTGPVEAPTRLAAEGNQVAASGQHYLEIWRSDLVRTLAYGRLPTPAQPATQPRPDCLHGSMAVGSGGGSRGRLAVVERCLGERARLTVQRSDPKEPDQPEVIFSVLLPGQQATVVALSGDRVAAALPGPARLVLPVPGALAVLDTTNGEQIGALPVDRGGYRGPVDTAGSGEVVLEQRGDTVVALH